MRDTVLFDLDGTLLPLDMDRFIEVYFQEMSKALHDIIEPKKLISSIWAGTDAMVKNIGSRTNEEVFIETFQREVSGEWCLFKERFDDFYEKGFLKVRETVKEMPLIKDCIRILKEKGYTLAIATNPIFPKSAVYRRIEWAGLDPRDFVYISHFEKNCYCKPDISFYREVLDAIGKRPEQCIMVGNDVQEDMCAGELGIETFLITDYLIDRSNGDSIICTHKGTYETFHKYVQGLPPVKR